jgi:tol-pal system protein YbgF
MKIDSPRTSRILKPVLVCLAGLVVASSGFAGIFEDDDARKAILDLRQQVEQIRSDMAQLRSLTSQASADGAADNATLGKSLLDLQRQLEGLKTELAVARGKNEELTRDLAELQRLQKSQLQGLEGRVKLLEPISVKHEGAEFVVEPAEKREFEAAWATFRQGDFALAQTQLGNFVSRFPVSGYANSALFWLGNAQYATRDYKESMNTFRALLARGAEHPRVPEAVLSIANCQVELKDTKAARKTLADLIKSYPQSEAALAAKERLLVLK